MKTRIQSPVTFIFSLFILLFISLSGTGLLAQEYSHEAESDLVWGDEFEGSGDIDGTKWERQEYNRRNNDAGPDGWWSKDDSYLDGNGNLVIRVREIPDKNNDGDSCDYSVGALRSKGKFSKVYGKYEIRCKLPTQPGWWVAFWMMQGNVGAVGNGGVDGMEVDIMEGFGWTNLINNALHWDGYGDDHKSTGKQFNPAGIRDGFHTFAMEWYPEMYVFFIDGKETFRSIGGGVCNQPGYVKVTGEISTESWAITKYWAEHPAKATYPDSFLVDYIRVYDVGNYQYPAGTGDVSDKDRISLYPNPAADQLILSWDEAGFSEDNSVTILTAAGQTVKSFRTIANNTGIPVNDLHRGLYFLRLEQDGRLLYLKFIKS